VAHKPAPRLAPMPCSGRGGSSALAAWKGQTSQPLVASFDLPSDSTFILLLLYEGHVIADLRVPFNDVRILRGAACHADRCRVVLHDDSGEEVVDLRRLAVYQPGAGRPRQQHP
jgi:hypothetical protein